MRTALYGKIEGSRETGGEWLIGAITKSISYFSVVATQYKTKQRRAMHLGVQACINDGYSPESNCRGGGGVIKQGGLVFYYKSIDWGGDNK